MIDIGHQISHDDMNNESPNEHGADHVKYHIYHVTTRDIEMTQDDASN